MFAQNEHFAYDFLPTIFQNEPDPHPLNYEVVPKDFTPNPSTEENSIFFELL